MIEDKVLSYVSKFATCEVAKGNSYILDDGAMLDLESTGVDVSMLHYRIRELLEIGGDIDISSQLRTQYCWIQTYLPKTSNYLPFVAITCPPSEKQYETLFEFIVEARKTGNGRIRLFFANAWDSSFRSAEVPLHDAIDYIKLQKGVKTPVEPTSLHEALTELLFSESTRENTMTFLRLAHDLYTVGHTTILEDLVRKYEGD